MRSNVMKGMIAAVAAAAALVFLHWAIFRPTLIEPGTLRVPMFVEILLGAPGSSGASPLWFRELNLALIAVVGLVASGLSLFILFKSEVTAATRRLAAALALSPLSAAFFFFIATHGTSRQALRLDAAPLASVLATFAAYAAGLVGACLMVRFFLGYPRAPGEAEVLAFYRKLHAERLAKVRGGWRKRIYGRLVAAPNPEAPPPSGWKRHLNRETSVSETGVWHFFGSRSAIIAALLLAAFATGVDFYTLAPDGMGVKTARLLKSFATAVNFMFIVLALGGAFQGLQYHHREAIADDRARIEWIHGALVAAALVLATIPPLWWAILIVLLPSMEPSASLSGGMMFFGPGFIAVELLLLAFVGSLALSIFYRGAVDPRLAMRRVTVFGLMSLAVAVLFVVLERAVAMKIVAWLQLPNETGALIAAGAVASLAPVRTTVQRALNGFVSRYLPLESLMQGERKQVAVVISDISGYTALSARDEKQAMLLAALLQRHAQKLAEGFDGRVVKSMGDAVIIAFDSASSAVHAMEALHREFAATAPVLGLEPLPMHSGAHFGEVTQTHDGDLYGQTVNIAARLLSLAAPGQRVVSAELAEAASLAGGSLRSMGPRQLKNVPQPVVCHEVMDA